MAEQLCDLLGMNVDDYLRLTEIHILPYLVLMRKRDIIARIGASYKKPKSPFELCSENNNLASILSFLLSQHSSDPEGMIVSLFQHVDSEFKGCTLATFLRTEPILIACELLKNLGDAGDGKGDKVWSPTNSQRFLNLLNLWSVSWSPPASSNLCTPEINIRKCTVQEAESTGQLY